MNAGHPPASPDFDQPRQRTIGPRPLIVYGALLGLLMSAAASLWVAAVRDRSLVAWYPRAGWAADLALGSLVGVLFALALWALADRYAPLRRIRGLLSQMLDLDVFVWRDAALIGLVAGIPEEILFRGAIQPELGWALTSILFGALHAITPAYFLYATAAGALLGGLADWRGGLWAPTAAHCVIDALTIMLLRRRWRAGAT